MTGRAALVLAVALLGVGFALGYVVGEGARAPGERPDDSGIHRELQPHHPPPPDSPIAAAELEGRPDETLVGLRRALATLPPPEVERGDGVITGVVKTEAGAPVAGVEITCVPESKRPSAKPKDDLTEAVRAYAEGWRRAKATTQKVVTDARGRFRVENLADVAHHVTARLEGWSIHTEAHSWRIQPGTEVRFRARRDHRILVHVLMPDGTRPETATIHFKSGNTGHDVRWSKRNKRVRMSPGTYEVSASAGENEGYGSEAIEVVIPENGEATPITLRLQRRPAIIARVRYAEGQRLASVEVKMRRLGPSQKADAALLASGATTQAGRGDDPTLTFRDLKPGRYLLGVSRGWGGKVVAIREVNVEQGPTEVELPVPPIGRDEYVVVRVVGPDGKLLSGAQISTSFRSDKTAASGGGMVVGQEDGSKLVLHSPYGNPKAKNARYGINVFHPQLGRKSVTYVPGGASDLEIQFVEPVVLDVKVGGLVGTPYDGRINATLHRHVGDKRLGRNVSQAQPVDERGATVFAGVQPGEYEVALSLVAGHRGGHVVRQYVRVEARGSSVDLTMPALYEVTFEGVSNTGRLTSQEGYLHPAVRASDDGRAVVDGLPAGTYTIRADGKSAKFKLPGTSTVRLE